MSDYREGGSRDIIGDLRQREDIDPQVSQQAVINEQVRRVQLATGFYRKSEIPEYLRILRTGDYQVNDPASPHTDFLGGSVATSILLGKNSTTSDYSEWDRVIVRFDHEGNMTLVGAATETFPVDEWQSDPELQREAVNRALADPEHNVGSALQKSREKEAAERARSQARDAEIIRNREIAGKAERERYSGIRGKLRRKLDEFGSNESEYPHDSRDHSSGP